MIKPINYQKVAVEDMLRKIDFCIEEGEKEYLFQAPTGSGKTTTTGILFEEYMKKHKNLNVGIVWISPGKGDLAGQSKRSMESNFNYFNSITLQDVINQGEIKNRDVVFINWESINKKDNVSIREGEKTNIYDVLENSNLDKFIIFVDESHESRNSIKANELLNEFNPDIVVDITATPRKDRVYTRFNTTKVDINDVIAEEFIKNQIIINEDVESLDLESILKYSLGKRDEIEVEYRKVEPNCKTPLLLIQIENDSKIDTEKGKIPRATYIKNKLLSLGVEDSKIGIWVSNKSECQNLDSIKESDVEVLIFKSAIATGYDIDRAHVLTRLRELKSEVFGLQVLGRILRTVNKKFYNNKLVDSAYVYTQYAEYEYKLELDEDVLERVREGKSRAFIKPNFSKEFNINIPMYKKQSRLDHSINSGLLKRRVDKELPESIVNELELDENKLNEKLYRGALDSGNLLKEDYLEGLDIGEIKKSNKKIKEEFIKKTRNISPHIKMTGYVLNALKIHKSVQFDIDAMKLYLSNEVRVNELILTALKDYYEVHLKNGELEKEYVLPSEVYYNGVIDTVSDNYVYTLQPNLSVEKTKSSTEELLGNYLSYNKNVKYWYKNNVGGDNFSVVYKSNDNSTKEYYPDFFIIDNNNKLYIVDVKAPIKDNTTNDFKDIESKYSEGKEYENKNLDKVKQSGFTDFEFSMIKFKEEVPYICKTQNYNTEFEDELKWEELNI